MICLKNITKEHCDYIRKLANTASYCEFFRSFPPTFIWAADETVLQIFVGRAFLVCDEDEPKGLVMISREDPQNKIVDIGVVIEGNKRRGYIASQAMSQLGSYYFDYKGYHKVTCHILEHRLDLAHILEKFNFQPDGVLRDNVFFKGKFHNEVIYSLLEKDFIRE